MVQRILSVLLLLTLLLGARTIVAQTESSPPASAGLARGRAAHLRYGINLSEWFAQVFDPKGYTKEHFEAWTTAQDIALIKEMGFDHVRLSVNPVCLFVAEHRLRIHTEAHVVEPHFLDEGDVLRRRPGLEVFLRVALGIEDLREPLAQIDSVAQMRRPALG